MPLQPLADPAERASEVVGKVFRHFAHPEKQFLVLGQHGVQALRQPVELVAPAGLRDPAGEIAGHDLAARPVDAVDPAQDQPAQQAAGRDGEQDGDDPGQDQRLAGPCGHPLLFAQVVADQQVEAALQPEHAPAGFAPNAGRAVRRATAAEREGHPAAGVGLLLRPRRNIAGQPLESRIDDQIDRPRPAALAAPALDGADQPDRAELPVLLRQALDLGIDRGLDLPGDGFDGGKIQGGDDGDGRDAEDGAGQQRKLEDPRSNQPDREHGCCTRRRAPCG